MNNLKRYTAAFETFTGLIQLDIAARSISEAEKKVNVLEREGQMYCIYCQLCSDRSKV